MTEFITRNYGQKEFEVIIKTDNKDHYKATEDFARKLIDHAKPLTNADRIRAMSDEELKYVARAVIKSDDCPMGETECIDCVFHDLCLRAEHYYGNEEEWLQQPADKGE